MQYTFVQYFENSCRPREKKETVEYLSNQAGRFTDLSLEIPPSLKAYYREEFDSLPSPIDGPFLIKVPSFSFSTMISVTRRAHKWARTHAPSDQWRQRLLKSCVQRMKATREASLSERRKARMRIVEEETRRLRSGNSHHCELVTESPSGSAFEEAELLALLEDLDSAAAAEQREADEYLQEVFESLTRDANDDVAELIDFHEMASTEDAVLCPVCCNGCLQIHNGCLSCRCGLRAECGAYDNVTPSILRERLAEVISDHSARCPHRLVFEMRLAPGSSLWAKCETCIMECRIV